MRRTYLTVWPAVIAVFSGPSIAAALPPPQQVSFSIRETPSDPNSPILFTVTLSLTAVASADDWIAWEVSEALFSDASSSGRVWAQSDPFIETTDGLWWVQHQDVDNPFETDFRLPPSFGGIADPVEGTADPLDFSFGSSVESPPGGWGKTTTAKYWFQPQLEAMPVAASDDDGGPVEIDVEIDGWRLL